MKSYRVAGQEFHFPGPVREAAPFEIFSIESGTAVQTIPFTLPSILHNELIARTEGWVAGAHRMVETWSAMPGFLIRIEGVSDFTIRQDGKEIQCASQVRAGEELNETERQILLGPVVVLALALQRTWSLHASAAICNDNLILFLGESGQGKSTLAAYLANEAGWRLAADDILPVSLDAESLAAWPRFPQLKLPMRSQPGPGLPEQLSVSQVCILSDADVDEMPALQRLSSTQAVKALLGHTAGTRMFPPELLANHLAFCSQSANRVPVYRLAYPHRLEALPVVKALLENLC